MKVFDNVLDTIGFTPIVRLNRITAGTSAEVFAKLEFMNPAGSVKDRIGRWMIEDAERRGLLRPGGVVVEGTGGNTGIGLAMAAAVKGYRLICTVPDKMSEGKIRMLRAFGAEVVVTRTVPPPDPDNYCAVARRIAAETPNSIYLDQYNNPANPGYHYRHTGPEIVEQLPDVDVLVGGLGTGGTLCGTGRYFAEQRRGVRVIGVDPVGSVLYDMYHTGTRVEPRPYLVEGIGKDSIPGTMDFGVIDDVLRVTDRESSLMTRQLLRLEGIHAGISSGSALAGALRWMESRDEDLTGKKVLVIFPDSGSRYMSKVYDDDWMAANGLLDEGPEPTTGPETER
ncbi:PLP-dependent cysteine synthase family protein [Streptomyces sp. NPDC057638]|uniref:PLP-dependent cysteine synthase family protein n=1 Tax=Streptomyces sp. NPDC057638 TaxID=3346190 RepID=UPI0036BD4F4E